MSQQAAYEFVRKVSEDQALAPRLTSLRHQDIALLIDIATNAGYSFSGDEFWNAASDYIEQYVTQRRQPQTPQ